MLWNRSRNNPLVEIEKFLDFNVDRGLVTMEPYDLLPHGLLVIDRRGKTLLIWWDVYAQKVAWTAHTHPRLQPGNNKD